MLCISQVGENETVSNSLGELINKALTIIENREWER